LLSADRIATLQISLFEQTHELARTRMKEVMALTTLGLRSMILLSGGAIVSLFTLLGHSENLIVNGTTLWIAFSLFSASLSFSLVATFLSFFSQNDFLQSEFSAAMRIYSEVLTQTARPELDKKITFGNWTRPLAIVCAALALIAFIGGSYAALQSIKLNQRPSAATQPVCELITPKVSSRPATRR